MTKWIKDVDTGELFPVQDDFECEFPAHLEKAEYTPVDYDKTTKMTIDELQNQLIAAQNEIESIQQEKGNTSVSEITEKEVYPETISRKRFDFNLPKVIIAMVVTSVCTVFVFFGFKFVSDNDFVIDTTISETTELDYEVSPIYSPGSMRVQTV